MNDRFFLDTHIFVYFDQSSVRKSNKAEKIVRQGVTTWRGVVSYQVVQEFLNVALRRFHKPMSVAEAVHYVGTVFRPLLSVHSSESLFADALRLRGEHQLSWYDALIVAAALESECTILYTEDLQHGQRFGNLEVCDPFV